MLPSEVLHPALRIALAWQPKSTRTALETVFAFDAHLGRLVSQAKEPVLTQLRLAWWRERLGEAPDARPLGDPVLEGIGKHWAGGEDALITLVDGWEELLGEAPLVEAALGKFAEGRGEAFAAFARIAGATEAENEAAPVGRRWALADFAFRAGDQRERERALSIVNDIPPPARLPPSLRGLSVLGALTDRALDRDEPLCSGRIAPLVALRVGMTGR